MLATGSADATVRVWDVGEEVVPHADEWTRIKRGCLRGSSNDGLENEIGRENAPDENSPFVPPDIVALENAIVHGQEEGDNNSNNTSSAKNVTAMAAASQERARRALRSLRPEILRQAGVRPSWRTGRLTAVLDRLGMTDALNHRTVATSSRAEIARTDPLIEVRTVLGTWGEYQPGVFIH